MTGRRGTGAPADPKRYLLYGSVRYALGILRPLQAALVVDA